VKRTIRLIDSFIARASVLSTNQNATKQFFCLEGLGEGRWRAFQPRQKWVNKSRCRPARGHGRSTPTSGLNRCSAANGRSVPTAVTQGPDYAPYRLLTGEPRAFLDVGREPNPE
jgi:hypothetical protein